MNESEDEFDGRPAPLEGCECRVCTWVRSHCLPSRLIRPSDPEWELLIRLATRARYE
jgi:hypothetical protein